MFNSKKSAHYDQAQLLIFYWLTEDEDGNGLGDICTSGQDYDKDGIDDNKDNCLMRFNPEQLDEDLDGLGNECDDDIDNDSIDNFKDNCKLIYNPFQEDTDGDGKGNKCQRDEDGDGIVIISLLHFVKNDTLWSLNNRK